MTTPDKVVEAGKKQPAKAGLAAPGASSPRGSLVAKRAVKKILAPATATAAALKPEQIAFLGEHAAHHKATSAKAFVQVLFWQTLPDAWSRLTSSWTALVAASRKGDQDKNLLEAFKDTRSRLDDDSRLANFDLRLWSEHVLPLQLEIANLAAAAISRYLEAPSQANPIFDAVASKLVNPPSSLESRKRR